MIGQSLGIGALDIVSIAASLISVFLSPAYVRLLGVLLVLIGIKRLVAHGTMPEKGRPQMSRASTRSNKSLQSLW